MFASLSRQELINWATKSIAFYGLDLSRISTVLLSQAFSAEVSRSFSVSDLTNPIKALEGLNTFDSTQDADKFKHLPLRGLYKKHFTSPRFLVKNLLNFSCSKEGRQHFKQKADEAVSIGEAGIDYLVHHMVVDPIKIKSGSGEFTGEWVVFHKHHSINYYLTLAFHHEEDEEIYKRIVWACEFDALPFEPRDFS